MCILVLVLRIFRADATLFLRHQRPANSLIGWKGGENMTWIGMRNGEAEVGTVLWRGS
jgi:hypothetical protein